MVSKCQCPSFCSGSSAELWLTVSSGCSSAQCSSRSATYYFANGRMGLCRAPASLKTRCALRSDRLNVSIALKCTDQPRNHHRKEQLATDHLECRDAPCNIGARQDVAIAERREGDEAVIDCGLLGYWLRPDQAAGPHAFQRPIYLPKEHSCEQICAQGSVNGFPVHSLCCHCKAQCASGRCKAGYTDDGKHHGRVHRQVLLRRRDPGRQQQDHRSEQYLAGAPGSVGHHSSKQAGSKQEFDRYCRHPKRGRDRHQEHRHQKRVKEDGVARAVVGLPESSFTDQWTCVAADHQVVPAY